MKKWTMILLLLMLVGLTGYHFIMSAKNTEQQHILLQTVKVECNPAELFCRAGDTKHVVSLHFPENVAYLKPFKMRVAIQGFDDELIEKINVDFKMVGMDMGLNRFSLTAKSDAKGNVYYEGEGILPVCVSGRVDWLANTQVITTDKFYEAAFQFKVGKHKE